MTDTRKLSEHEIRAISVAGLVDPRTIRKHLRGETVRILALHRIRIGAQAVGLMGAFPELDRQLEPVRDPVPGSVLVDDDGADE